MGVEGDCAETYYRINVFYPAVDAIKLDVELRFGRPQQRAFFLSHLLPRRFTNDQSEQQLTGHYPLFLSYKKYQ